MGMEEWFKMMERLGEADYPFIIVEGISYTPRTIISHAMENDETWLKMKLSAEKQMPVNWELLRERLEMKYEDGRLMTVYMLHKAYTPEDQIAEIEAGSAIGIEFMLAEHGLIEELKKRMYSQ